MEPVGFKLDVLSLTVVRREASDCGSSSEGDDGRNLDCGSELFACGVELSPTTIVITPATGNRSCNDVTRQTVHRRAYRESDDCDKRFGQQAQLM